MYDPCPDCINKELRRVYEKYNNGKNKLKGIKEKMTLEESIEFDDKYTNTKIKGLDMTSYFESHGNNDIEICKKCIHGDNKGGCVTRYESLFNSFGCIKNNQFEEIKEK